MHDYSIDAIKVAKAIQKNELSILDGKEFKMRDKIKKKKRRGKHVKKSTLSQRMDQLEASINKLAKTVDVGFKQVNNRINNLEKDINTRLDYIVKANDLKDSPR